MTRFVLLLLGLQAALSAWAQTPSQRFAIGGAQGIYLVLGTAKVSKAQPVGGIAFYRIERKKTSEKEWTQLADVESPNSLSELQTRLDQLRRTQPDLYDAEGIPLVAYWTQVEKSPARVDTFIYANPLAVRLAMGMFYLDSTAERNTAYQYRVSRCDASGNTKTQVISASVSYPQSLDIAPKFASKYELQNQITLRFVAKSRQGFGIRAFRREGDGAFEPLSVPYTIARLSSGRDSLIITLIDSLVAPSKYYQYFIVPRDYYRNIGTPSDTTLATTFDFRNIPLPDNLRALNTPDAVGLQLSWRMVTTTNIVSVEIYRSTDSEKGFERIATVPPTQTTYLDESAEPMQRYFYRLVMTGPFGERSQPSTIGFGIYESRLQPMPPRLAAAEGMAKGVRLKVETSDPAIIGYRIYRNARYGDSLQLISGLVPLEKIEETLFVDSSLGLSGRQSYGYAVRSESKSHVLSDFSDTLYARPAIALSLPTPTGLSATQPNGEFQKTVSLFWLDMTAYDEAISGYRIYRRQVSRKAKSDFKPLLDSLLPAEQNYLTDTTLLEFGVYEYAVQAFGRFESKSTMSAPVQVEYKKLPLAPPADVRAAATTEGVKITWGETVQERLSGYRLYRYERGKTPTVLATLQPDQQEFLDKSAKKGALYFYFITSLEKEGESAPSEEVGVRP
ncbi:MAG: hypothetical protein ACK41G_11900 [Candidatus Thermochlorobacter sp.]